MDCRLHLALLACRSDGEPAGPDVADAAGSDTTDTGEPPGPLSQISASIHPDFGTLSASDSSELAFREYEVDTASETLRQVSDFGSGQGVTSIGMGDAYRLPNGNVLHNYGYNARTTYVLNENGYIERIEVDNEADGDVDFAQYITTDSEGHWLTNDVDYDGDGQPEMGTTSTYSDEGLLLEQISQSLPDGEVLSIRTSIYDPADSNRWSIEIDYPDDGLGDEDADGILDGLEQWESDDAGNFPSETYDWGPIDGVIDYSIAFTYAPDGQVLTSVEFSRYDATTTTTDNTYDPLGRLIEQVIAQDTNGMVRTSVETWTFGGTCP